MADFVKRVAEACERPAIDRTGIAGEFDFDVLYSPNNAPANAPPAPPITNMTEALGLRFESARAAHPVLVIDSIDGEPTTNQANTGLTGTRLALTQPSRN